MYVLSIYWSKRYRSYSFLNQQCLIFFRRFLFKIIESESFNVFSGVFCIIQPGIRTFSSMESCRCMHNCVYASLPRFRKLNSLSKNRGSIFLLVSVELKKKKSRNLYPCNNMARSHFVVFYVQHIWQHIQLAIF